MHRIVTTLLRSGYGALGIVLMLVVSATLTGAELPDPSPTPAATELTVVSSELKRVLGLLEEQQKTLDALREMVIRQERRIEQLNASVAPVPSPTNTLAAKTTELATVYQAPLTPVPKPQAPAATAPSKPEPVAARPWYQKYSFRGYTQLRNNRLFATNGALTCEQCDRSIGYGNAFLIRRARFILFGDINDRVSVYFQPDFASTSGNLHFGQVRDLYFDISLDKKKEFRIRAGQSKVPFGFEDLQSSQNRLPLDRSDSTNSAVSNERDLGAFFYWAPAHIRQRFSYLVSSGLKGSGDYGVVGTGIYNGQTANRAEANSNLHSVARVTYPWQFRGGQFLEAGVQGYSGRYGVTSDQRGASTKGPVNFTDRRAAASIVLYPQPFGFQAEYNVGRGPRYNPATQTIESSRLFGGYAQMMYRRQFQGQALTPFVRVQYYNGGKKHEFDARRYLVREQEFGIEWQQSPFVELTAQYTHSDRTYEDSRVPNNRQKGNLLRLQLQLNY